MRSHRLVLTAAVLLASLGTAPAQAARSYDSCKYTITSLPAVIASQGSWCLQADLATSIATGNAITIQANNVTLDCNDFKLGGLGAGIGSRTVAIAVEGTTNVTIRNCNVRGFSIGVRSENIPSTNTVVEDSRFEGSLHWAIFTQGDGHVYRRNTLLDTGGGSAEINETTAAIFVRPGDGLTIDDNRIDGVVASAAGGIGSIAGIEVIGGRGIAIRDNRVGGIVPERGATMVGIEVAYVDTGSVRGNDLFGDGDAASTAISCGNSRVMTKDNVIAEFGHDLGGGCYYADNADMLAGDVTPHD